ncbi:transport protein [Klebsiella grimontii]|uniref:Transport protein n=1 Tax=Klebsiella grimontii TaxID=2058152 RepID=A0A7H4P9B7_9ENTR|nr:transport protein [Klebsiella grimontii]
MFKSFFPKPGPFFISAFIWSLLAVIFWQAGGGDWLLRATGASQDVAISAARFWSLNYLVFYAFYVFCVGVFALFWFIYSPHRWQYWSILGTSLIIFVTWFLVEVGVAINAWYAPFYDLIQAALATPHKVSINQFYHEIGIFLGIALIAVIIGVMNNFFVSHYVFPLAYRHERTLYGALAASAPYRRRRAACAGRYHALCFHPGEHGRQLP